MKKACLISLFLSLPLSALVSALENLQTSGFGTIGTVAVDSEYYGYRNDLSRQDGTFDGDLDLTTSSILGLQFDYLVNSEFDLVYQAVYRDQEDVSFDSLTTLAFLKYSPSAAWSFRFGRTAFDLFLLTEYRDVGFASTWAHAPTETYGLVPFRFLDGSDFTYTTRLNELTLRSKFFWGKTESDVASYDGRENIKLDNIFGAGFEVESVNWNIKSKYTSAKISENIVAATDLINGLSFMTQVVPGFDFIWPDAFAFGQSLLLENAHAEYFSLSGRYDLENWSLLGETSLIRSDSNIIPHVDSGYLSAVYRTDFHNFYLTYAKVKSDHFDINALNVDLNNLAMIPGGLEIYFGSDALLNSFTPNQQTVSLGWRWNITDNTAFNIQWDRTQIKEYGASLWLNKNPLLQPAETVNAIFSNLSFAF